MTFQQKFARFLLKTSFRTALLLNLLLAAVLLEVLVPEGDEEELLVGKGSEQSAGHDRNRSSKYFSRRRDDERLHVEDVLRRRQRDGDPGMRPVVAIGGLKGRF